MERTVLPVLSLGGISFLFEQVFHWPPKNLQWKRIRIDDIREALPGATAVHAAIPAVMVLHRQLQQEVPVNACPVGGSPVGQSCLYHGLGDGCQREIDSPGALSGRL